MAGRRPKPTHLRLLQGNPGKRPINKSEPKPEATLPDAPDHLSEIAKKEWKEMGEHLLRLGLLTSIDRSAFAGYCTAYARHVEAEKVLGKNGFVVRSPNNYPMLSPFYTVSNQAMAQMRSFLIEFGMTPSSRSRISLRGNESDDPMEGFLFGK